METPPDLVIWIVIAGAVVILVCTAALLYWANCAIRMCARQNETIRAMGLAASNPLMATKLEQQRLRQQVGPDPARSAMLAEIASHQGAKARERHAQNRAAHPAPTGQSTFRYVSPDDDLLPEKAASENTSNKPGPTTHGAPQ